MEIWENLAAVVDSLIESSFDSVMVTEAGDGSSSAPIVLVNVFVNDAFTALTGFSFKDIETPELPDGDYDAAVVLAGIECSEALPVLSADGLFLPAGANASVVAHLTGDGSAFNDKRGKDDKKR